jgi:hypothetical protein
MRTLRIGNDAHEPSGTGPLGERCVGRSLSWRKSGEDAHARTIISPVP